MGSSDSSERRCRSQFQLIVSRNPLVDVDVLMVVMGTVFKP